MTRLLRAALISLTVLLGLVLTAPFAGAKDNSPGDVVARIDVGGPVLGNIFDGAFGAGALWVSVGDDTILRIDPATNGVDAEITVGAGGRHEIAVGEGGVWVTNPDDNTVSRINPATNAVVATIDTEGFFPIGVTTSNGAVWVANHHADESDPDSTGSVVRIDPSANAVVEVIPVGAPFFAGGPGGMTTAGGSVWVSVPNLGGVVRIDPSTNAVAGFTPAGPCGIPAAGVGVVWMPAVGCSKNAAGLARIDSASGAVEELINPGGLAWFAAEGFDSAWVSVTSRSCQPNCPPSSSALVRLDAVSAEVLGRLPTDGFGFVAIGAGSVWAGASDAGEVLRIDPN